MKTTFKAIVEGDLKQLIKIINTLRAIDTEEFSSSAPIFQIVWTLLHSILPLFLSAVGAVETTEDQHSCCDTTINSHSSYSIKLAFIKFIFMTITFNKQLFIATKLTILTKMLTH
jgi:hypothetical protein